MKNESTNHVGVPAVYCNQRLRRLQNLSGAAITFSLLTALSSVSLAATYNLRLHVIPLSNSDGSKPSTVTAQEFAALVKRVNDSYANTDIQFIFDSKLDWAPMKNTELNTGNMTTKGNAIAATLPGKIVCFLRWGDGADPTGNGNAFPPPGAGPKPSHVDDVVQNYVALPNKIQSYGFLNLGNGSFVAHELGHYLGLYHTFPGWHDRSGPAPVYSKIDGTGTPSATAADQAVVDYIVARGGTIAALDGDGVADTPPDPSPVLYDSHSPSIPKVYCSTSAITAKGLNGTVQVSYNFAPDTENVMSYFQCNLSTGIPSPRRFSPQQIQRMLQTLKHPSRVALIMPSGNWISTTPADALGRYFPPEHALVGGQDGSLAPLYICRGTRADGSIQPGSIRSGSSDGCVTGYGSLQENVKPFEFLVTSWDGNVWDSNLKKWVYTAGEVPLNAFQGGAEASGEALYYCRAVVGNSWQPGKIRTGFGGCYVSYGGQAILTPRYQVLVRPNSGLPLFKVAASYGSKPSDAVRGGVDTDGENLFLCEAQWGGGTHPGRLKPSFGSCLIAYGTSELQVSTYKVVVARWASSSAFGLSPIPRTFPAGKDTDGETLFVCRAQTGSAKIPGKFRPTSGKCHIGLNGAAVSFGTFELLTDPSQKPF